MTPRAGPGAASAIAAIAANTFREAVRDRILYLILVFALGLIVASRLVALLTVGSEEKIIKDLGLSSIAVFGVLTAVFVGVSLVFKEIDRRTIYTLLAGPVTRWHFLAGKYAGILAVLAMNVALMGGTLGVLLLARGENPWPLLPAVALIFMQHALVAAFALLFSTFTNPILAAAGTLAVYVTGHLSFSFDLLKSRLGPGWGRWLCDALHAVLPNLDRLDVKAASVHGLDLPAGTVGFGVLYAVAYASIVIVAACLAFERREFL